MLTTTQIEEIRRRLQIEGSKDTSFENAKALNGNEILALVQEGINKKMSTRDFAKFIAKFVEISGGGTGGGSIDPAIFTATINAYDSAVAEASVDYDAGEFKFNLGLPRGEGIQGPVGPVGPQGPEGKQGPQGERGPAGDVAVTSFTAETFRTYVPTKEKPKPDTPVGGSWDGINVFTHPLGWGPQDGLERPVWKSSRVFFSDPALNGNWSEPIQISGDDGEAGTDGESIEFMYKLTEKYSEADKPTIPVNQELWIPSNDGWTDDPSGISPTKQCEWVIFRNNLGNNTWSDWKGPSLWAKWGDQGQDGAGVEYIYWLAPETDTGKQPSNPTPNDWKTNINYQDTEKEYDAGNGWTDNPTGVSDKRPYEWVCVRKYRHYIADDGTISDKKMWLPYEGPTLWSHYGENGYSGYSVRTLYAKGNDDFTPPAYVPNNSNPGSYWGAFPIDYNEDMIVWAIDGVFSVEGELIGEWTAPRIITGIRGSLEIPIYYTSTYFTVPSSGATPYAPEAGISIDMTITSKDTLGNTVTWQDIPDNMSKVWYQCTAKVNSETRKVEEWGAVSIWNSIEDKIIDGTHWEVRVAIISADDLDGPDINRKNPDPNYGLTSPSWKTPNGNEDLKVGEGQRMWETKAKFNPDGSFASDGWCYPYPISGEKGPKGDTGPTGPEGPNGVSGISYEERYMIGNEESPINEWNDSYAYVRTPEGWDLKISNTNTSTDYPYIWCIKARINGKNELEDGKWEGPFRISGINGINGTSANPTTIGTLTNPTDIIICDPNGKVLVGLPIETTLRIFDGDAELPMSPSSFKYEVLDGAANYLTISSTPNKGTIKITEVKQGAPKNIYIKISGKGIKDSAQTKVEYSQIFTLKILNSNDVPIQADLSNESVVFPALHTGELLVDTADNFFNLYIGTTVFNDLDELYLSNSNGNTATYTGVTFTPTKNNNDKYTGRFSLTLNNSAFTTDVLYIYVTAKCTYENKTHTKTLPVRLTRIRNGENSKWYELNIMPQSLIYYPDTNSFNASTITIKVDQHEGSSVKEITVESLKTLGLTITAYSDNEPSKTISIGATNITLSGMLNTFTDLEERIVFELKKDNELLDRETIPVVSNGSGATVFKLVASTDVIQHSDDGTITNIEESEDKKTYVNCYVVMLTPSGNTIINNAELAEEYLDGLDLKVMIDGEFRDYTPGENINAYDIESSITFYLIDQLQEPDATIDLKSITVLKPQYGRRGQLVYPAGIYSINETYITTDKTAPYVLDDGKYYVLNAITEWKGSKQDPGYNTPSLNYQDGNNPNAVWEPFEMYEAVYADIGVFNQALVGSAVFYKEFIFSQNGIDKNGKETSHYENFLLDENKVDLYGTGLQSETNPYDDRCAFKPAFCINCKTGETQFACGKVSFYNDGSGKLGGLTNSDSIISWDKDGNVSIGYGSIVFKNGKMYSNFSDNNFYIVEYNSTITVDHITLGTTMDVIFNGLPSNNT